jgi:hypothetical protein
MACHLIGNTDANPLVLRDNLKLVERLYESDHFDVTVRRCSKCGQLFIYTFLEYTTAKFEDETYSFWIPITQEILDGIKNATARHGWEILYGAMGELVRDLPHYCWNPDDLFYWSKSGDPIISTRFIAV